MLFAQQQVKMNSSDEENVLILLLLRRRRKRRRQSIWCREHCLLRESKGEFHRTFQHPLDNPDEELFFNYARMSYNTYNTLKSLVLERLKPHHSNCRYDNKYKSSGFFTSAYTDMSRYTHKNMKKDTSRKC